MKYAENANNTFDADEFPTPVIHVRITSIWVSLQYAGFLTLMTSPINPVGLIEVSAVDPSQAEPVLT